MTAFKLMNSNPFNGFVDDIIGVSYDTDDDNINIGDYGRLDEEGVLGIRFAGIDEFYDKIDPDTKRCIHGGDLKFEIVYYSYNIDHKKYKTVYTMSYEYSDNMSIIDLPSRLPEILSEAFCDFVKNETNIRDFIGIDFLSFMFESDKNRTYYARFMLHIITYYVAYIKPRLSIEEVEYYTKLKRIVNILDGK